MSDEIKGYDRSNTNRLVSVEGPRVRGTFSVLKAYPDREAWVTAHDVTVYWDDERSSGRILYSKDLTGSVKDGVARLEKHSVASNKLADVEQVWDEMLAALVVAVEAADFPVPSPERGE